MDRLAHLNRFLEMSSTAMDLSRFPWDCDAPLVQLQAGHIVNALSKFVAGGVSAIDVETWANTIEGRDDIGYSPESPVGSALHELANPLLTQALSRQSAQRLIAWLQSGRD